MSSSSWQCGIYLGLLLVYIGSGVLGFVTPLTIATKNRRDAISLRDATTTAPPPPLVTTADDDGWKGHYLPELAGEDSTVTEMEPEEMLQEWFPLSFEAYLKEDKPNAILHMGRPLVVWKSSAGADGGTWHAQDDMCPHKLAPLSDGSITADGKALRCSLHGWQFKGCGTCSMIPALPAENPIPPKCNVRSYPIRRRGNMLWIWMDPSVQPKEENIRITDPSWELNNGYQRDLPYSWDYLFENILDPTHVAYAHAGVGREFNRTEVDEIRDEHLTNLQTKYNNAGVQLKFNRTINGRNTNETWDFMYPGVWFLRRNTSDRGAGGVIMGSPIDAHSTRIMSAQYNPQQPPATAATTATATSANKKKPSWIAKLKQEVFTVMFHRTMNRFFNSDAFLIRYQQELAASGDNPTDPLAEYELASPADQGTVAFRRWHLQRLGGRLPMAKPLLPKVKATQSISQPAAPLTNMITREQAADPWEQHTKNCPSCLRAYNLARKVSVGSTILAAFVGLVMRRLVGNIISLGSSTALIVLAYKARKFAQSFKETGHQHH